MRIAIVDDDAGIRNNLGRAVNQFEDCTCVGEFESGEAAMARLPSCQPDIVLMDINMPGMSGIECVHRLKSTHQKLEFIMLTVYEDSENIFNALAAGASGYLLKRAQRNELHEAIQQVHSGGSPMTSHIARKVVQSFRKTVTPETETQNLTARELQVLEKLAEGLLYKEIAEALDIGYDTVHNHIRHIYEKLQVRSRAQAVAKYLGKKPLPQ